jgi:hypothetical protein
MEMAQDLNRKDSYSQLAALPGRLRPVLEQLKAELGFDQAFVMLIDPATALIRDVIGLDTLSPLIEAFGVPPRSSFDDLACANASGRSAARLGLPAPRYTVMSAILTSGRSPANDLALGALQELRTEILHFYPRPPRPRPARPRGRAPPRPPPAPAPPPSAGLFPPPPPGP